MHGLINKSVQAFLRDHYGQAIWTRVAERAGVGRDGFEAMLHYDDALTETLLRAAEAELNEPRAALLEDIGAYLAMTEPLRRLLRFGGSDYWDFLYSLDDLQGRGLMALPDLDLPDLTLLADARGHFTLRITGSLPGWGAVLAGLLRAMADDYGALVVIEPLEPRGSVERLRVLLLEADYSAGRRFDLAPSLMPGLAGGAP